MEAFLPADPHAVHLRHGSVGLGTLTRLRRLKHGHHAEETDQGGHQADAAEQIDISEGQAGIPVLWVHSDDCDQQADHTGKQPLGDIVAADAGDTGDAQKGDRKILAGAEFQGHLSQHGSQKQQHDGAEQTAEHAGHGGCSKGQSGLALLCQRVAVKCGCKA